MLDFLNGLMLSSATNMVTQIIYLGEWRLEIGITQIFLHKYFSIGFPHFGLGHFNMN